MINNPISFIDGIYSSFTYHNNTIIIEKSLDGYNNLLDINIGQTISYLIRDSSSWEMGIGEIDKNNGKFQLKRVKTISSSNSNNLLVDFTNSQDQTFCIIPNQYNFNTGFNNLTFKNTNFVLDKVKTTYYVDTNKENLVASLPLASETQGLVLEIKLMDSENTLVISTANNELIDNSKDLILSKDKQYTRLISTGTNWIELLNNQTSNIPSHPVTMLDVNGDGIPGGTLYSLQYNSLTGFDGLPAYYNAPNLLFGGSGINSAHSIFPLSGVGDVIFNNNKGSGNFLVHGKNNKNLFFDSDGKLGVNIPSGLKPASALHIINNNCLDGIRLDNKNNCHPATLTLHNQPSTNPSPNTLAALINLSGKNSVNQPINYVQLKSKIVNSTIGNTQGEFIVSVENAGQSIDSMIINKDRFSVACQGNLFEISVSGTRISGPLRVDNLNLDGGVIAFSGLSSDNSPIATRTPTPTITNTSTPTPTPTLTLTPTLTEMFGETPTPTPTETISETPTPTPTPIQ